MELYVTAAFVACDGEDDAAARSLAAGYPLRMLLPYAPTSSFMLQLVVFDISEASSCTDLIINKLTA